MSQRTTPETTSSGPPTGSRRRRVLAGLTAATVAATAGVLTAAPASAAVPVFPDNITIFPDRDFVSIDGFVGNAGKPITVEVVRGGTVIGSATGPEAGADVINAGNPAIEINHPGGICWGAGGGVNATPDILPGDQIVVKLNGATAGAADATTLSPKVTGHSLDQAGTTLTVTGTFGPDVDPTFLEQRIINPDLKNTDVNFRDVRAVPGPPTPDRRSPTAYSSGMAVDTAAHTFTATYTFANAATAKIADAGALRSMSWQNLDANANRQGVTIQEDGELGGPGFGGCPAAAVAQGPASPTNVKATDNGTTTTVTWTKPTVTPGTSPIVGYTVRAVAQTSTNGGQDEIGKRISDPAATTATLPTALAGKTVEVRSYTAAGESWPPAVANKTTTGTTTDTTLPTVTATPPGGNFTGPVANVTLTASEPASIVYTLDGSDPLVSADVNQAATPYTVPFTIPDKDANNNPVASVTLRYVAIDGAGNPSLAHTEIYKFGAASTPAAPTINKTTAGNTTIDVIWTAPANPGSSPITGYKVTATPQAPSTGAPVTVTTISSATTATLTGLTNGSTYTVSVLATNATGDGAVASVVVPLSANPAEVITPAAPVNKPNDFRVKGSSSATSGSVSLFLADTAGNQTGPVLATSPLTAAAAPATGTTFDLRARTNIAAGTKLVIVGSNGGKAPVTA